MSGVCSPAGFGESNAIAILEAMNPWVEALLLAWIRCGNTAIGITVGSLAVAAGKKAIVDPTVRSAQSYVIATMGLVKFSAYALPSVTIEFENATDIFSASTGWNSWNSGQICRVPAA